MLGLHPMIIMCTKTLTDYIDGKYYSLSDNKIAVQAVKLLGGEHLSHSRDMNTTHKNAFPIACLGASAGGLEALIALLKFLPKNINMSFVLIQHLEPQHKSALAEILSRETLLDVREAKNNTKLEPSHVYVIPPNTRMTISRGKLTITARTKRMDGKYLPIDFFMTSLAQAERENAIGIVLSGTGSDGTQGVKAIKAKGGITFAQDQKTSRYFGMPESAIASGSVDLVLGPKEIAQRLVHLKTDRHRSPLKQAVKSSGEQNDLNRILVLLRALTGVDYIHYKQTTIGRRIARRMALCNIENHEDYYNYLKNNKGEADVLRKEIIVPVTFFFRNPELFAALREKVFPLIIKNRSPQNPVRLWVPACSSGEEVYSLAILLYEFLEEKRIKPYIQIFGTDVSEAVIEKARSGLYAQDISAHISSKRLRRFFMKTETGYKIAKHIRDLCIFARHDLTDDPPLSNMDIVSCRNLLIYLDTFLQNKTLSTLHYALTPKGFLILGSAESVTAVPDLFTTVDIRQKIYSKSIAAQKTNSIAGIRNAEFTTTKTKHRKAAKKILLKQGPNAPLMAALPKKTGMAIQDMPKTEEPGRSISEYDETDIVKLRKEYTRVVTRLNVISEEKDTFNEELQAANEEIQSSNEELQSMNEELETSKEELQSTNEELITLNDELQDKNSELLQLNSDLSNIFSSTNIPIIIVDNDLHIKRFTPTARKVMNLIPSDVARPIDDIKLNVDISNLDKMILSVIEDMLPMELEAKDKEGRWYSVRIRPYRTVENKIDGAVITMVDIDAVKRSSEKVQGALDYARAIVETMKEPLLVLDKDVRVLSANKAFYDTFRVHASDVTNKSLFEIGEHQWDILKLRKLIEQVVTKNIYFSNFEVSFDFSRIGQKTMNLNGRQIKMHGENQPMILLVIEDITKRKKADEILKRDSKSLKEIVKKRSQELMDLQIKLERTKYLSNVGTLAATIAHELRNTLTAINIAAYTLRRKIRNPEVKINLMTIDKMVMEGNQIINNVLEYSKVKSSHFKFVKINSILKLCMNEAKKRALDESISLVSNIDVTEGLSIDADPTQIKEVISNILNNALDAVIKNTGVIKIATEIIGSKVSVSIIDNGEGIPKEDLKKVLSPFFTTKAKGTGLGLAVCNQIIMLHNGSIVLESNKKKLKGTKVQITLPIHRYKNA